MLQNDKDMLSREYIAKPAGNVNVFTASFALRVSLGCNVQGSFKETNKNKESIKCSVLPFQEDFLINVLMAAKMTIAPTGGGGGNL